LSELGSYSEGTEVFNYVWKIGGGIFVSFEQGRRCNIPGIPYHERMSGKKQYRIQSTVASWDTPLRGHLSAGLPLPFPWRHIT